MNLTKFTTLMERNRIIYGVIASLDSGLIQRFGDVNKLQYKSIADRLFEDTESIKSLNESLEDQLLPRKWRQGQVACIVCKPNDVVLVGLFYHEDRDILESYNFSQQVNEEISEVWGSD